MTDHVMTHADAIVVGGGPAGTAIAATLAGLGLATVLLASRRSQQEHWIETAPVGLGALLPKLGLPTSALLSVGQPFRWRSESDAGHENHASFHVDRAAFDMLLQRAAVTAGTRLLPAQVAQDVIREGDRVVGVRTASGFTVKGQIVLDASGGRSWLKRRLGLVERRFSPRLIGWRGQVTSQPARLRDCDAGFSAIHDGWLFLATWRGRTTWTSLRRGQCAGALPDVLAHMPITIPARAWNVGWRLVRPLAGRGWLLAGDAGGRLDPGWGRGLVSAIASGIAAAHAAAACLMDPGREALYLAAYDGWFADRILDAAETLRARYAAVGIPLVANAEARSAISVPKGGIE